MFYNKNVLMYVFILCGFFLCMALQFFFIFHNFEVRFDFANKKHNFF